MSLLQRFLGIGAEAGSASPADEPAAVRRIAEKLEGLEPDAARRLAAFAYVLARVAHADLEMAEDERAEMQRIVRDLGGLDAADSQLVVEIAASQASERGGTQDYLVTREYRRLSERAERTRLVECLFAVAAADGSISSLESDEVLRIAEELGLTRPEALALRASWRDHLAALQNLPSR